jgi:CDP-diacylglycerol---serine O-phosphatidyltransferase
MNQQKQRRRLRLVGRNQAAAGSAPLPGADPAVAKPRARRGIYLLPNLFTLAALFSGFYAVVMAMNGEFEKAAIAIFASMVLDGMDGRVARLTNTQSAFGEQFDSLADMVSFGVAPALVMYEFALADLGRWGWLAAFTYCAGAALRLARFNTNIGVVDKRFFQGMPSPAAGALMAGFIWLAVDNKLPIKELWMPWTAFGLSIYAGLTMVSNAPFFSGKQLALKSVPFWVMIVVLVGLVVISSDPPIALFGLFCVYGLSGYLVWAWRRARGLPSAPKLPAKAPPSAQQSAPPDAPPS